jgi:hypothetical protein
MVFSGQSGFSYEKMLLYLLEASTDGMVVRPPDQPRMHELDAHDVGTQHSLGRSSWKRTARSLTQQYSSQDLPLQELIQVSSFS